MNLTGQYNELLTHAEFLLKAYQEKVKDNKCYQEGQLIIEKCKEWITNKEITADDIYETVDSEDGYDIVEFSYMEGITEEESSMWVLFTDIVCVLCSLAYQMESQKYVPQVIECIKFEKIEDFVIFLNRNMKVHENIKECAEYFAENVCY
ncbi:immunity protein Imm6 of predicted polymorphic toxin system [Fontibacillus phaseoli]|uniref:Immunity protein Imm6 of predicted polymorphic toxin system n=1 Tax=Fontibacillus phaseoli TaxID=1416533 RepID=A0A369BM23_9BACL|nr:Imm6 family immunity protein [Fontibacillus phaseoli]RCX21507.1 immunity protein Imm6 of predicted polymorphic toxin system [Fontibacillus phaseoli]